jgi:hypothetical protein
MSAAKRRNDFNTMEIMASELHQPGGPLKLRQLERFVGICQLWQRIDKLVKEGKMTWPQIDEATPGWGKKPGQKKGANGKNTWNLYYALRGFLEKGDL